MSNLPAVTILPPAASGLPRSTAGSSETAREIEAIRPIGSPGHGPRGGAARDDTGSRPRSDPEIRSWVEPRGRDRRDGATNLALRGATDRPTTRAGRVAVGFLAQLLGQEVTGPGTAASGGVDAGGRGTEAYRRAGAEPRLYAAQPVVFSLLA